MAKFQITTVDLQDKTFEVMEAEGGDPTNAYVSTIEDLEPEEHEGAVDFYKKLMQDNPNGGWIYDCEDGLILIVQLPEL